MIDHVGFSEAGVQGPKVDRNLRLLELERAEQPNDSFILYNLGAVRLTQSQSAEALDLFRGSLRNAQPNDVLVRKLHSLIARAHYQLGQKAEALEACRTGLAAFPGDGELLFWEALLHRDRKELGGAAACLERILQGRPPHHFTSVDAGLYGYRTRHFLGEVYRDQGRLDDAEEQWRVAIAEFPSFAPSRFELANLHLQSRRWPELAEVLQPLENDSQTAVEAMIISGRACLSRKEFTVAKAKFQTVIAEAPKAVLPRTLLSHALLQEESDWPAAQQALLDVLGLDPTNREAQHNLRILRHQHFALRQQNSDGSLKETILDAVADDAAQPGVSLCVIVRNEEHNLPGCLESVADLVDEIIVVDTGSTDRTKEIALERGAKVFDFPWIDDFAAARNESLRHARGRWIFWLDADDRLDTANRGKLRSLLANLTDELAGYVMKCVCLPDSNGVATVVDHLRLFRNHPQVRWTFRVHEQILPALRNLQADVRWSDVAIHHTGYQDTALRQRKLQRDLRLLQLENADKPGHPFVLFNLGGVFQELGRKAEALEMFRSSLAKSALEDSIVRKLYAMISQCHRSLGQKTESLAACREGLGLFADDIELQFQHGVALQEMGKVAEAAACWERCLQTPVGTHFASINTGLTGYIARHNLATAYLALGKLRDAEEQWKAALADRPHYEPACRGLADVYFQQERWGISMSLSNPSKTLRCPRRQAVVSAPACIWSARILLPPASR